MSRYQDIEGQNDFVRDTNTGAILNINKQEIQAARERKKLLKEQHLKEKQLEEDVQSLKDEMSDIKSLLSQIVEKL